MTIDPQDELEELERRGLLRRRCVVQARRPGYVTVGGREYVDFSANDYLGLASDPRIAHRVADVVQQTGWGATASPLVTGFHELHEQLETELARFLGSKTALVFESGFAANTGAIAAIVGPEDVIFCEKRNHASLVDGCRLSGAKLQVFRCDRLEQFEQRLAKCVAYRRRLVVTDTVFSMDGDVAPLREISDIAKRFDALIWADEAHAFGVLGPSGRGVVAELELEDRVDFLMVTLGKALGSVGAAVACSQPWRDVLINRARTYIYSTGLPPVTAAATLKALEIAQQEPQRRERVLQLSDQLRSQVEQLGFDAGGSTTPIIPILVGEPERATSLAAHLRNHGHWVTAIRPPTVATGTSRIRVTLSAAHEKLHLEALVGSLSTWS